MCYALVPNVGLEDLNSAVCDALLLEHAIGLLDRSVEGEYQFVCDIVGSSKAAALSGLMVEHLGIMLVSYAVGEIESLLEKKGFCIVAKFPSEVVVEQLRMKYKCPSINVVILKAQRADGRKLEIFVVKGGLSKAVRVHELVNFAHVALTSQKNEEYDVYSAIRVLTGSGFTGAGGGVNELEGVTVLYFKKTHKNKFPVRVELMVPGIRRQLLGCHLSGNLLS